MPILSMTSEYALLAMIYIACKNDSKSGGRKAIVTVDQISKGTGIPSNFLSKIMNQLSKSNLIHSSRGCRGGYCLSRSSSEINAMEVIEAVEGEMKMTQCLVDRRSCPVVTICPYFSMWGEVQVAIQSVVKKYSLHSMAVCLRGLPEEEKYYAGLRQRFSRA
ncbi:MAG: Rrf2 family transcriptional regulator [Elusimicrobia bacterium]|nr:Rrf2 family transcriptional regulator [Elusimicrobiota bacterium]